MEFSFNAKITLMAAHRAVQKPSCRFLMGAADDAPILVPLPNSDVDSAALIRFCRRIRPGSSILVPHFDYSPGDVLKIDQPRVKLVDDLAHIIGEAVAVNGLALVPLVLVGHAAGAILAAALALKYHSLCAACVFLRPTSAIVASQPETLNGVFVLLSRAAVHETPGAGSWQIRHAMMTAGAHVISEPVSPRNALRGQEVALARVFLSTLFGPGS